MDMSRKKYICGGCGKVIISGKRPHGWKKICSSPERCICDQCIGEMGTPDFQHDALLPTSIALAIASS